MKPKKALIILLQILVILTIVGWVNSVYAARVTNLYTAEVLVAEQSVTVDPSLAAQGLRQVIIKVSGRTDVVNNARIQTALAEPNRYIQQFSYQQTRTPVTTDTGHEVLAQKLIIEFNQVLVDQLLSEANIRPLGASRPGILVWLVEERNGQRSYIGQNEDPAFALMIEQARSRGLPLFRPLLDLQDEQALPVSDAWGFFADSIRAASARYQADAILVGRLYQERGGWQSDWQIFWPQHSSAFSGQGQSLDEQLASAVETAADRLFADYVSPSSGYDEGGVQIVIQQVRGLEDYFQIRNYLHDIPAIRDIQLYGLDGDQLSLKLMVDGAVNQVKSAIGLNQRFIPQGGMSSNSQSTMVINYRWRQ